VKKETDDYSAGEMRHYVTVQKPVYSDDGSGGQTLTSWATTMKVYCYMQQKKSWEKYGDGSTGGRVISTDIWEFTTWWRAGVETTHRLAFGGKVWNIRNVENLLQRNKYLRLTAEAGVET
jgi:head-tail adaptor